MLDVQCATVLARLFSKNGVVCVLDLLKKKLVSIHCGFFSGDRKFVYVKFRSAATVLKIQYDGALIEDGMMLEVFLAE